MRTMSRPLCRKVIAVVLAFSGALAAAWTAPGVGRGQEEGQRAAGRDLLRSAPFDRITLTDGTVLEIEPLSPRPLPEYDEALARRVAKRKGEIPHEGNILLPRQEKARAAAKKREDEARRAAEQVADLTIKLLDDPILYSVKRTSIQSIEYFEDMLLTAGARLVRQRDFARAFEHYLLVQNRAGDWPGLREHVESLLYEEGTAALTDGDIERGLRLLRELHDRRPDFPGLTDRLAQGYAGRVRTAFDLGDFPEGRRILHDLEQFAPGHRLVAESRALFEERASALVAQAAASTDPAVQLDALTDALRVWPTLDEAEARYREAFAALPTLDVAVADVARPIGPWVHAPADARVSRLVYLPLLAAADEDALRGRRADQLAAGVAVADLGRRLDVTLRAGPAWSDGSGPVTALDVARALTERADPGSPRFQARWADLLDRAESIDPRRVLIVLRRAPLTPGAWLRGPIGPAHASRDGLVTLPDGARRPVGDGPYRLDSSGETATTLRAVTGSAAGILRVREVRVPDGADAVRALKRGEVTLLAHVPPGRVAELRADPEIEVGHLVHPGLHALAIDGRSEPLRNRTLRRAISYAIDRAGILETNLLGRAPDAENRPLDGVFAQESYGNAPGVAPLEHDPLLARMLVAAARKELGGDPISLRLEYPARPEARAAVPRIVAALRAAGLEIEPSEQPESVLETDLRAGRRFDLAYRALACPEPVADVGPWICPGYDAPTDADGLASVASPRILQLLLELEHAPEFPTARGLVQQIDRESRDELPLIPLWQLRDHYAWRTRLTGPAEEAEQLYQGIEHWEIEPWFARDTW